MDYNNFAFSKTFCFVLFCREKKYLVEHFLGKFFLHAEIIKIRKSEGKKCNCHILCAETLSLKICLRIIMNKKPAQIFHIFYLIPGNKRNLSATAKITDEED